MEVMANQAGTDLRRSHSIVIRVVNTHQTKLSLYDIVDHHIECNDLKK